MCTSTLLIAIVLYHPDKNKIVELIRRCRQYAKAKILLFDNSESPNFTELANTDKIICYQSAKNVGVGGAHYYACQLAEAEQADFVLLLDQDSQLPHNFIKNMVLEFHRLQKSYSQLAAVGPSFSDPRFPESKKRQFRNRLRDSFRFRSILISSGMLILVSALKNIGYPKKEYFIDLVDTEWCLRALYKNYHVIKIPGIQMKHSIGETKNIGGFILKYQQPIRYYYSIRNSFFLFHEQQIALSLRVYYLLRNMFEIMKLPFVPAPIQSSLAAWCGLKDGLKFKKNSNSSFMN